MKFKAFVAVFFIVIIVIFSLQNAEITDIKFLFWKLSISRILIIVGCFVLGIIVGLLLSIKRKRKF